MGAETTVTSVAAFLVGGVVAWLWMEHRVRALRIAIEWEQTATNKATRDAALCKAVLDSTTLDNRTLRQTVASLRHEIANAELTAVLGAAHPFDAVQSCSGCAGGPGVLVGYAGHKPASAENRDVAMSQAMGARFGVAS